MERKKKMSENKNLSWSFSGMYSSPKDPKIEKDTQNYENLCDNFEKKYKKSTNKLLSPSFLLKALEDYKNISETRTPFFYVGLFRSINAKDDFAQALEQKLDSRKVKANNKILFFENYLGKTKPKEQKLLLKDVKLEKYAQLLQRIFITGKYNLSDNEEKIINLMSAPAYYMWTDGGSKKRSLEKVVFKGKSLPLSQANNMLKELPTNDRRIMDKEIRKVLEKNSDYAENEINAIYTFKKIDDELRGHKSPYESTLLHHDISQKTLESLLGAVKDGFKYSKDFYTLKKDLLKLPHLKYCDRSVSVGKIKKKFSWKESIEILRSSFGKMDKEFLAILDEMLKDGRIDVLPRLGKRGGAFCASETNEPVHVMLNHINDFNSLMTFAHEMGHAIHSHLSSKQPSLYQHYSLAVAETASTFFERVVFDEVFEDLDIEDKKIAMHDRIQDDVSTIFRQVSCFMYELDMHEAVRKEGFVSKEIMAEKMNQYMAMYIGSSMKFEKEDGLFFVDWPHLRYYFYVYTYAFGQIVSKALYEEYKKDNTYVGSIKKFLGAGKSMSPEDIFKSIGVKINEKDFFKKGIDGFAKDIKEFKKVLKKS